MSIFPFSLGIVFATLAYSSYSDLKSREVADKVWIVSSIAGLAVHAIDMFAFRQPFDIVISLISVGLTSAASLALYWLGFFGGADAKALIAISIVLPTYSGTIHPFAALTVLSNGVILTILLPLAYATKNLASLLSGRRIFDGFESERTWKKALVCFLGYRVRVSKPEDFMFSLEKIHDGKRVFSVSLLKDDEFASGEDIWVTPGIPLLIFFFAGLVTMILVGDLLFALLRVILPPS